MGQIDSDRHIEIWPEKSQDQYNEAPNRSTLWGVIRNENLFELIHTMLGAMFYPIQYVVDQDNAMICVKDIRPKGNLFGFLPKTLFLLFS